MVVYAKLFGSNSRVGRLPVICQKYQNNVRVPNDPSPIAYGQMKLSQKPLISKASSRGCVPGYSIKEGSGQACPSCTTCYPPMYRVAKLAVLRSQQVEWAKCRGGCVEYKIWDWVSLPVIPHSFALR